MRIGLIFGGRSVEHEVSVASARTVARGLRAAGHGVIPLGIGPDGCWIDRVTARRALDGELSCLPAGGVPIRSTLSPLLELDVEAIFPIVHGTWGEDGTLQGLCEMLDIPYAGAGVAASAVAMDKVLCKHVLRSNGIPVVDAEVVTREDLEHDEVATLARLARLTPPVFVKPAVGGSSVGVSRVEHTGGFVAAIREAFHFDDRLLVEQGIVGRELECAVLGHRRLEASVIGEIVPGRDFYDYADKYLDDTARLLAPATVSETLDRRIRELSIAAFAAIGGHGMARVDFLLRGDDELYVNEINTHPGFTDISMYPRLWGLSGVPLPDLVDRLVAIALERHADRHRLDSGIKAWLSSLAAR
jgi:D-alanine-D-alanine ligase